METLIVSYDQYIGQAVIDRLASSISSYFAAHWRVFEK